jgi:hypothetical protein
MRGWIVLVTVAALAGCYDQPTPACSFGCRDTGTCPDGYQCSAGDGVCHRVLPGGGLAECPELLPDAQLDAPVDAPAADASPDATTDAPVDAAPPDA